MHWWMMKWIKLEWFTMHGTMLWFQMGCTKKLKPSATLAMNIWLMNAMKLLTNTTMFTKLWICIAYILRLVSTEIPAARIGNFSGSKVSLLDWCLTSWVFYSSSSVVDSIVESSISNISWKFYLSLKLIFTGWMAQETSRVWPLCDRLYSGIYE